MDFTSTSTLDQLMNLCGVPANQNNAQSPSPLAIEVDEPADLITSEPAPKPRRRHKTSHKRKAPDNEEEEVAEPAVVDTDVASPTKPESDSPIDNSDNIVIDQQCNKNATKKRRSGAKTISDNIVRRAPGTALVDTEHKRIKDRINALCARRDKRLERNQNKSGVCSMVDEQLLLFYRNVLSVFEDNFKRFFTK